MKLSKVSLESELERIKAESYSRDACLFKGAAILSVLLILALIIIHPAPKKEITPLPCVGENCSEPIPCIDCVGPAPIP